MIYLFASDIHGSSTATQRLLDILQSTQADKLILLGDLLYHGPRNALPRHYNPKTTSMLLNNVANHIFNVRGNCDAEVDQQMLAFPVLNESAWMHIDGLDLFLHHGHKELPPLPSGTIIVSGHTHIPLLESRNGFYYLNPGSISLPKEGYVPSYTLLEERTFTVRRLDNEEILMSLTI